MCVCFTATCTCIICNHIEYIYIRKGFGILYCIVVYSKLTIGPMMSFYYVIKNSPLIKRVLLFLHARYGQEMFPRNNLSTRSIRRIFVNGSRKQRVFFVHFSSEVITGLSYMIWSKNFVYWYFMFSENRKSLLYRYHMIRLCKKMFKIPKNKYAALWYFFGG